MNGVPRTGARCFPQGDTVLVISMTARERAVRAEVDVHDAS
jgi:hypothetical protein